MKSKKEVMIYLIFGVLTTLVNIITYWILVNILHMDYKLATSIAWLLSVLFAFITNKLYVFNSKSMLPQILFREFLTFFFFRLFSYLIDLIMMIVMVEWLLMDDLYAKILANIVVVIMNFFASKFLIFRSR